MEIIKSGVKEVKHLKSLSCCFPPGTEQLETPEVDMSGD